MFKNSGKSITGLRNSKYEDLEVGNTDLQFLKIFIVLKVNRSRRQGRGRLWGKRSIREIN